MKNYPIHESKLDALRQVCKLHGLKLSIYPSLKKGMFWATIYHENPARDLAPELCFALGQSFEIQCQLMERDRTAQHVWGGEQKELIDVLP